MHIRERKPDRCLLLAAIIVAGICCPAAAVQWSWQVETADHGSTVFYGRTSIALDTAGYPHISFYDYEKKDLRYAVKSTSGAWTSTKVDGIYGDVGESSSLELARDSNLARISYHDETKNRLKYAQQYPDGSWWDLELDDGGQYTSLALDGDGHPHISYTASGGSIKYTYRNGSAWHYQVVGKSSDSSSLALDSDGNPAIAFSEFSDDVFSLQYATIECTPPHPPIPELCLFVPRTVDSEGMIGGQDISLFIDHAGHPHITYWDMESSDVRYATKDAGGWHLAAIDNVPPGPAGTSIAVDSAGYPAVSYQDSVPMDLVFSWKDAAGWHTMTIDKKGNTGAFSSLAFDRNGSAHISYIDQSNKILKYAKGTRVIHLPGINLDPADPDLDGIFEDLNGNGRLDFADVVLYFNQMTWIAENEPVEAFDLNGNGRIDFADIVTLFNEI